MKFKVGDYVRMKDSLIKWNLSDVSFEMYIEPSTGDVSESYHDMVQIQLLAGMKNLVGQIVGLGYECFRVEFQVGKLKYSEYISGSNLIKSRNI
jgi:hypothetical protein